MKERPIIFSAPMVRAILSGAKTQTRRVMKVRCHSICEDGDGKLWPWSEDAELAEDFWHPCPFGKPGDRLWVRETWQAIGGNERARRILAEPDPSRGWIEYAATVPKGHEPPPRWRPSIHMPRWASRITLEITDVRVERLQDICEADAMAEGMEPGGGKWHSLGDGEAIFRDKHGWFAPDKCTRHNTPRFAFREAWEAIHGQGSWNANPWVWAIKFKRLDQQARK